MRAVAALTPKNAAAPDVPTVAARLAARRREKGFTLSKRGELADCRACMAGLKDDLRTMAVTMESDMQKLLGALSAAAAGQADARIRALEAERRVAELEAEAARTLAERGNEPSVIAAVLKVDEASVCMALDSTANPSCATGHAFKAG